MCGCVAAWLQDFAYLRPYKEAAELLAAKEDWGALYDASVLGGNAVPSAAISYVEVCRRGGWQA